MKLKNKNCYCVLTPRWKFPTGKPRTLFVLLSFPVKWNRTIYVMLLGTVAMFISKLLSHFLPIDANWSECGIKQNKYLASMKQQLQQSGGLIYSVA